MGGSRPVTGLSLGLLEGDKPVLHFAPFPISVRTPEGDKEGDLMLIEGGRKKVLSEDRLPPLPESSLVLLKTIGETGGGLAPSPEVETSARAGGVFARRISLAVVDWLKPLLCTGGRSRIAAADSLLLTVPSELTSSITLVIMAPVLTLRRWVRLWRCA